MFVQFDTYYNNCMKKTNQQNNE